MSKNESRKERRRQENNLETETRTDSRSGISKVYYYIIGFLFLVLLGLVIFIFSRSGNDVNLEGDNEDQSALVNEENQENSEPATENETENEEPPSEEEATTEDPESENEEETTEEEPEESEEESTDELQPGDSSVVNEDAPHDTDHATNYNDGSTDRVAIKNEIIATTGLNDDLIEWWVGNDGPGRVEATVSSRDQSEIYQVYLQYGDGNWHVLNYERLSSIPNN